MAYRTEHDPKASAIVLRTLKGQQAALGTTEFLRIVTEHIGQDQAGRLVERLADLPDPGNTEPGDTGD